MVITVCDRCNNRDVYMQLTTSKIKESTAKGPTLATEHHLCKPCYDMFIALLNNYKGN